MIAKTPPMGWNSWDCYGAAVTEDIVRQNAEFMAKHLKQYGWEYIVVDIQWYEPKAVTHVYNPFTELCMDAYSRLIPDENRFPSSAGGKGFAPLAEYVHGLGLKFGIHIMRGIPRQAVHQNTGILGTDKTAREIAKTASIISRSRICGGSPMISGINGSCFMPCLNVRKSGVPIRDLGIGLTQTCCPSARSIRCGARKTELNSQRMSRSQCLPSGASSVRRL